MLLSLNDDCLLYLCEFLNFAEQSILAHTSQRLQFLVEDNWTHKCKNVRLDFEIPAWFDEHEAYFVEFMSCICRNVEHLELQNIHTKLFKLLENLFFPKTTSFTLNFRYIDDDESNGDEDTKLAVKLFPQLKRLSFSRYNTTGNYLWNFTNLVELEIGGCDNLETLHFKKIFSTLRLRKLDIMFHDYSTSFDELGADIHICETLEELRIDDHHLISFFDELPSLKNLRKLVVCVRDYSYDMLQKFVERNVDTLIFDELCFEDDFRESFERMHNLRRLRLRDLYQFYGHHLQMIGKSVRKTLQEFRFVNFRNCNDKEESLIEFVNDCKQLEIFDISGSEIDGNFLRKLIDKLSVDFKNRKTPLIFRCFNTKITLEDAELLTIPNYLEVTLEKEDVDFPGSFQMQCEWKLPQD